MKSKGHFFSKRRSYNKKKKLTRKNKRKYKGGSSTHTLDQPDDKEKLRICEEELVKYKQAKEEQVLRFVIDDEAQIRADEAQKIRADESQIRADLVEQHESERSRLSLLLDLLKKDYGNAQEDINQLKANVVSLADANANLKQERVKSQGLEEENKTLREQIAVVLSYLDQVEPLSPTGLREGFVRSPAPTPSPRRGQ